MPSVFGDLLELARKAYLGEFTDIWQGKQNEVMASVHWLEHTIIRVFDENKNQLSKPCVQG